MKYVISLVIGLASIALLYTVTRTPKATTQQGDVSSQETNSSLATTQKKERTQQHNKKGLDRLRKQIATHAAQGSSRRLDDENTQRARAQYARHQKKMARVVEAVGVYPHIFQKVKATPEEKRLAVAAWDDMSLQVDEMKEKYKGNFSKEYDAEYDKIVLDHFARMNEIFGEKRGMIVAETYAEQGLAAATIYLHEEDEEE